MGKFNFDTYKLRVNLNWLWNTRSITGCVLWILSILCIWECLAYYNQTWAIATSSYAELIYGLSMAYLGGIVIYILTVVIKNWNLGFKKNLAITDRILELAFEFTSVIDQIIIKEDIEDIQLKYSYQGPALSKNNIGVKLLRPAICVCIMKPLDSIIQVEGGMKIPFLSALDIDLRHIRQTVTEIYTLNLTILTSYQIRGLSIILEDNLIELLERVKHREGKQDKHLIDIRNDVYYHIDKLIRCFNIALNYRKENSYTFAQILKQLK